MNQRTRNTAARPAEGIPPLRHPWGLVSVPEGRTLHRTVGPLDLWIRHLEGEIRLASSPAVPEGSEEDVAPGKASPTPAPPPDDPPQDEHRPKPTAVPTTEDPLPPTSTTDEPQRTEDAPPGSAAWSRWAPKEDLDELLLQPILPNRPLVLAPEVPFTLLPGARARVYVRVPLTVRVQLHPRDGGTVLQEISTLNLSDTWWGDFVEGELSYWLHTTARRVLRPELLVPHLAICPLELVNESTKDLRVEKLTLRTAHLTLFCGGDDTGGYWTDLTRVRYQGDAVESQIEVSGRAPDVAGEARIVLPPAEPQVKSFSARTFARLRGFPMVGL